MHLLFIIAIIYAIYEGIKTATTKPLPPNAFENNELYMKDLGSGIGMKQILKNAERGKYIIHKVEENLSSDSSKK